MVETHAHPHRCPAPAPLVRHVVKAIILTLWACALWQSWECRGLFSDGSVYFLEIILADGVYAADISEPREHAIFVTQLPVLLAIKLGVTDLHRLAQLYSLGLFGVPTALYSLALVRATRDGCVLAATLAATAMIFQTTSFFIIGESHTAYACAILAAVWLATAPGSRAADGVVLVVIAALASRSYEHSIYLGPLLGAMTVWAMARTGFEPRLPTVLHGIAAMLFFGGGAIAAYSLVERNANPDQRAYLEFVAGDAMNFRFNLQLDLLLMIAGTLALWGLLRPDDLRGRWPYLAAAVLVLLLAASPILVLVKLLVHPPYSHPQQSSRTVAGGLTALFIVLVWLHASGRLMGLRLLSVLKEPGPAQRLVLLASAMMVATLPWNIMLTIFYKQYLDAVRTAVHRQGGTVDIEEAIHDRYPHLAHHDIAPTTLSLIMRSSSSDGVLSRAYQHPSDVDPAAPPDLGRFSWRK